MDYYIIIMSSVKIPCGFRYSKKMYRLYGKMHIEYASKTKHTTTGTMYFIDTT